MSQLGLGCARLGSIAAGSGRRSSIRLVHEAVDHGIAWFDTADAYTGGTSESLLGAALRRRRGDVQIATKAGFVFTDRGPVARAARLFGAPLLAQLRRRGGAPT
jgi:aryl-alcohol dehydrogenase-like predicted oxidoreductase